MTGFCCANVDDKNCPSKRGEKPSLFLALRIVAWNLKDLLKLRIPRVFCSYIHAYIIYIYIFNLQKNHRTKTWHKLGTNVQPLNLRLQHSVSSMSMSPTSSRMAHVSLVRGPHGSWWFDDAKTDGVFIMQTRRKKGGESPMKCWV